MRFEFSENLNRLLRNSLTVETPDFSRQIAIRECIRVAIAGRVNRLFTMTGRERACLPLPVR
jgi:hypothetical protein